MTIEIGDRLAEERKRLKLSQSAMAEIGGIVKVTQLNYELGRRAPDADYLARVAAVGVDVLYVVVGMRTPPMPGAEDDGKQSMRLDKREQALIKNYEAADDVGKTYIEGTASFAAEPKAKYSVGGSKR